MELHHIALGAQDVVGVAAFYREVFGCEEVARHKAPDGGVRSVWLDAGGVVLMVEHTGAARERVEGVGAGPFLLAFRVGADERAALEERLTAAGAPLEGGTQYTSYARDPEGNRVAVSAYPDR